MLATYSTTSRSSDFERIVAGVLGAKIREVGASIAAGAGADAVAAHAGEDGLRLENILAAFAAAAS